MRKEQAMLNWPDLKIPPINLWNFPRPDLYDWDDLINKE